MASRDTTSASTPYQPLQATQVQATSPGYTSMAVPSGAFDQGAAGLVRGGQQLGEFGDETEQLALKMQHEDNEAAAREADIKVADTIRSVVWGSPDKPGYFGTKGKDALDNYGAAEDAINNAIGDAMKNAPNDMVARMLERTLAARRHGVLEQMNAHAGHQRNQYMDGLNEARQASAASDAALAWNSNQSVEASLGIIKGEAENMATRNGMGSVEPPKEGEQPSSAYVALRGAQSKAIHGAFDAALASGSFDRAKEIMTRYGGYLDGQTSTTMEKRIRLEQEVQENKRKQAENEYQSNLQDAMFNKLVAGNLSTADIANSGLKGRSKYQFMQLLEKSAADPADTPHPVLYNDLYKRVFNKSVDEDTLLQYGAHGELNPKEVQNLIHASRFLNNPADKQEKSETALANKAWANYEAQVRTDYTKGGFLAGSVDYQYLDRFLGEKRDEFDRVIEKGADPYSLTRANRKEFMGFAPPPTLKQQQEVMQRKMGTAKGVAGPEGAVPDDLKWRPDDTPESWRARKDAYDARAK